MSTCLYAAPSYYVDSKTLRFVSVSRSTRIQFGPLSRSCTVTSHVIVARYGAICLALFLPLYTRCSSLSASFHLYRSWNKPVLHCAG